MVDTSAWVEFDRATGSRAHLRVRELLRDDGPLAVCEPITMEVVSGARDDRRADDLARLLARATLVPFDSHSDFAGAATIYRSCRRSGVTPRGLIDCMIASVAQRVGADLLCWDTDFARIAGVMDLRLDRASLRPS